MQIIDVEKVKKDEFDYLQIKCTYPYLAPQIGYADKAFEDWGKGLLRPDRILHELCYILTDPLYVKANQRYSSKDEVLDERERLTDTIFMIIRNLIECQPKEKI